MDLPRSGGKLAGWAPHAISAGPGRERPCLTGGAGDGQQLAPNLEPRPLPPGHGARPGGHTAKTLTRPSHPTGCRSGWWCPGRDGGVRPPARPQAPLEAVSTQGPITPPGDLPLLPPRDGVCGGETEAQSGERAGSAPSPLRGLGQLLFPLWAGLGSSDHFRLIRNGRQKVRGTDRARQAPLPHRLRGDDRGLLPDEGGARRERLGTAQRRPTLPVLAGERGGCGQTLGGRGHLRPNGEAGEEGVVGLRGGGTWQR